MLREFVCTVCGHSGCNEVFNNNTFCVLECLNCKYGKIDPVPDTENLKELYNSPVYFDTHIQAGYDTLTEQQLAESVYRTGKFHEQYLKHISKPGDSILEIGAGYGLELKYLSQQGYKISGVEMSVSAVHFAKERLGISLSEVPFEEYADGRQYDIIMLNHVLEHFTDIRTVFRKLNALSHKKTYLYLRVPDHGSYDRKKYGSAWPAYLPFHISYFSEPSLRYLLQEFGWKVRTVNRYISEKFMQEKNDLLRRTVKLIASKLSLTRFISGRTITIIAQYNG